jgi:hypothetical protein
MPRGSGVSPAARGELGDDPQLPVRHCSGFLQNEDAVARRNVHQQCALRGIQWMLCSIFGPRVQQWEAALISSIVSLLRTYEALAA